MKIKLYKTLSILLALAVVISTCFYAVGAAETDGAEAVVYVGTTTSDTPDGSEGNPYATVVDAISAINTSNTLATGDTLSIVALNDVAWSVAVDGNVMTTPAHSYNVVVKSNTTAVALSFVQSTNLGGPTTFDNINATVVSSNGALYLYRKDFTLTETASLSAPYFLVGRSGTSGSAEPGQTVIINGSLNASKQFTLGNDWNNVVYSGDLNVTINDPDHSFKICFGSPNGNATYSNVKINLKAAKSVSFVSHIKDGTLRHDFTNGTLQVINSTSTAIGLDDGGLADIDDSKKWIVNNANTSYKNALDFTATPGKIRVNPNYNATATNADGSVTVGATAVEQTNIIDLTTANTGAGVYTANIEKLPATYDYYVQNGGTGDGTTEGTPAATVADAVTTAIANDVVAGDTLRVNVLGTTAVEWGTVPTHIFELYVTSSAEGAKVNLVDSLSGNTRFGNVELTGTSDSPSYTNGYSVVLEEGTKISRTNTAGTALQGFSHANLSGNSPTYNNDVYTEYKMPQNLKIMHGDYWKGVAYNGNVNFVLDNAQAHPTVTFGSSKSANAAINANLNIIIKKAKGFEFKLDTNSNFGANSAVQVVNSSGLAITDSSNGFENITTNVNGQTVPKWILNNNTGFEDLIELTDLAGKYKISVPADYEIILTNPDGSATTVESGEITLSSGVYTFTAERNAVNVDYYVSAAAGSAPDGSVDNPYLTVADAINNAISSQFGKKDTVNVLISGETAVDWGTVSNKFEFKLNVKSASDSVKSTINMTDGTLLMGDTDFNNINVVVPGNYSSLYFGGNNVTFGDDASVSVKYVTFNKYNGATDLAGQTVILNNPNSYYRITSSNAAVSVVNYADDVNMYFNNSDVTYKYCLTSDSGTTTYKKNLNINIVNAKAITIMESNDTGSAVINGALQIIVPGNVSFDNTYILSEAETAAKGYWYIVDNSAEHGLIDFTENAGVYTVAEDKIVHAYKDGEKVAEGEDGVLDLRYSGSGVYSIVEYVPPREVNYTITNGEKTVCQVIEQAISEGLTDRDTAVITLTGDTAVKYGYTTQAHLFKVVIKSEEGTVVDFVPEDNVNLVGIAGNTVFDGVVVKRSDTSSGFILFNGYDVEMTADTTISGITWLLSGNNTDTTTYDEQNLIFNNVIDSIKNIALASEWKGLAYSGNVNVIIGNSASAPKLAFGTNRESVFNGNINIILNGAAITSIASKAESAFNGAVQIISKNALKDTVYSSLNALTVAGGVYTVYDKTGEDTAIDFGDSAGEFVVPSEKTYRAVRTSDKVYADFSDGDLNLASIGGGHYFISIPEVYSGEQTKYAEYINYRDSLNGQKVLNNLASKLNNKEDINVVYYGGSVTAGAGVSDAEATSWRARIGSWLEVNFPQSNINNINSAIGGTSTYLGSYRLNDAVIEQNPDLLFIEFSINDYYDRSSDEKTSKQLETIIRQVREKLPECDIVTVLVTDRDNAANAQNGELHSQAKIHEAISAAYGIPTIQVGRALADKLPDGFTDDDWKVYFPVKANGSLDIVHPNENGYALYADVISEFLANSLLGNTTANTVVNHTVPAMINQELLDGNIKIYKMGEAASQYSQANGGSAFDLQLGGIYPHFEGKFHLDETSDVLVMQFEGTELALLDHHTSTFALNVQIDDGEIYRVTLSDKLPTVLASGLKTGTHKAEIWPAFEDGQGEWTNIYGLFGRDETMVTAKYSEIDGDANSDNLLDVRDLVLVDGIIDGAYTKYYFVDADVNADGKIDTIDIDAVRLKILGK